MKHSLLIFFHIGLPLFATEHFIYHSKQVFLVPSDKSTLVEVQDKIIADGLRKCGVSCTFESLRIVGLDKALTQSVVLTFEVNYLR